MFGCCKKEKKKHHGCGCGGHGHRQAHKEHGACCGGHHAENQVVVPVCVLPHAEGLELPSYETLSAAGADIRAAVTEDLVLQPGERTALPTGLQVAIPEGYELQIRARSGLAYKNGIGMANGIGTIDADYRGEIKVLMINLGQEPVTITRGMRVAQIVLKPVPQAAFVPVDSLDETDRGEGGFGSTGHA